MGKLYRKPNRTSTQAPSLPLSLHSQPLLVRCPIQCIHVFRVNNNLNSKVGIALSAVQEANMMDLLQRMGAVAVPDGVGHGQWIDASAAVSAISLAGEKAGGRSFQAKVRVWRFT